MNQTDSPPLKSGFLIQDKDEQLRFLQSVRERDAEKTAEAQANAWTMLGLAAAFVALLALIWVLKRQPNTGAK